MQIRRVRNEEDVLHRFVERCWFPYHKELSETVSPHSLHGDFDMSDVVDFYLDLLDSPSTRLWVMLEDVDDPTTSLSTVDATFAGFVQTDLRESPPYFDRPDRLNVSDIWVHKSYRGGELANDLMARVMQHAREDSCAELILDVAIENERAISYYENLGFEVQGFEMRVPLQNIKLETSATIPMTGSHSSIHLRRVRVEEDAMNRFVEECWFPFWRDVGDAVGEQYLSQDIDRDLLVKKQLEEYDVPDRRSWVALDDLEDVTGSLNEANAIFAGWLNAKLRLGERFLDPPEQLFIGNLFIKSSYRGTGLADHFVLRAMQFAREEGCGVLSLGVDAGNDRAVAYYEKLGFEPHQQRMAVPLDSIEI